MGPLKLFQMQVAAGTACAILLAAIRHIAPSRIDAHQSALLEAASFGLCGVGIITGGQSLRSRYGELNFDKSRALADRGYMRARKELQITALIACAAVGSLLASRNGISPLYAAVAILVGLAITLVLVNRAGVWASKR